MVRGSLSAGVLYCKINIVWVLIRKPYKRPNKKEDRPKSFPRDYLLTLGKGVLYGHLKRSGVLYGNHIYIVRNAKEDYRMENASQYVTKRELYFISTNILCIVLFAILLSDSEGFWKLYMALWAGGFLIYSLYKLRSAKISSQQSAMNQN